MPRLACRKRSTRRRNGVGERSSGGKMFFPSALDFSSAPSATSSCAPAESGPSKAALLPPIHPPPRWTKKIQKYFSVEFPKQLKYCSSVILSIAPRAIIAATPYCETVRDWLIAYYYYSFGRFTLETQHNRIYLSIVQTTHCFVVLTHIAKARLCLVPIFTRT